MIDAQKMLGRVRVSTMYGSKNYLWCTHRFEVFVMGRQFPKANKIYCFQEGTSKRNERHCVKVVNYRLTRFRPLKPKTPKKGASRGQ